MGRAVLFSGPGRPLELVRYAVPAPRGRELLVRITCCTLCRSDLHTHAGRRSEPVPSVLGHEIVGRIEAFGPEASRADGRGRHVTVGDRITWAVAVGCGRCASCTDDLPQKCERVCKYGHMATTRDRPMGGGLAGHIVLMPGTAWFQVPDQVPDHVAAPANCATATVAAVLRYAGSIAGRKVLVLGAGMLGATACAMARDAGAQLVLASDREAACRERALSFGAMHALPTGTDELTSGVAELTHGRGADVVLELAGTAQSVQAGLTLTCVGGTLVLAGTVAPVGAVMLDPEEVVRRMLTIRGVHNYHPRDLDAALAFLAGPGRAFPFASLISGEFPLEHAEQAFAHAHAHPGTRVAVMPGG
jgi:alcohol dehydrogenase